MDCQAYRLALLLAARQVREAHPRPEQPALPPECVALPALRAGDFAIRLWLAPQSETIAAARHDAMDEPEMLDVLCLVLEGLTIEEAANYGADYAVYRVARGIPKPEGIGILNPAQLFPSLALAQSALRSLRGERRQERKGGSDEAARYLSLPQTWLDLPMPARLERIRTVLAAHLQEIGAPAELLNVDRLEDDIRHRPVRVVLTHAKGENESALPALMRAIEQRLRREVAPWLEVYSEERVDRNTLRRMIVLDNRPA